MTLSDEYRDLLFKRIDELHKEADLLGIADEVHMQNVVMRIEAYAYLLGYNVELATDPTQPLTREAF